MLPMVFPGGSEVKDPPANAADAGSILQYLACLMLKTSNCHKNIYTMPRSKIALEKNDKVTAK